MSELSAKGVTGATVKPLQVAVMGKVTRVRRYEKFFYTTVICPAADQYSRPSVVEIRSKGRIADTDDETRINATLGGYEGKQYSVTDRETGERKSLVPVHLFLDAVEG